jgi:hypothetical protein
LKTYSVIFKTLSRKWLANLAKKRGVSAPHPRNAMKLLHLHPCNTKEIKKFHDAELGTYLNFRYLQGRNAGEMGSTPFLFSAESD